MPCSISLAALRKYWTTNTRTALVRLPVWPAASIWRTNSLRSCLSRVQISVSASHSSGSRRMLVRPRPATMFRFTNRLLVTSVLTYLPAINRASDAVGQAQCHWRRHDIHQMESRPMFRPLVLPIPIARETNSRGGSLMLGRARRRLILAVHHAHRWRAYSSREGRRASMVPCGRRSP